MNVNVFFDVFYEQCPNLYMVLVYNNKYYFTPLDVHKIDPKQYLYGIPFEILDKLLDEKNSTDEKRKLNKFFNKFSEVICFEDYIPINCCNDQDFVKAKKQSKNRKQKELPFLAGLRRANMPDLTFKKLKKMVDEKLLNEIKNNGFTIVRTDEIKRRKDITIVLKQKLHKN